MTQPAPWRVSGTYFEVCSCEAICPCRKQGGKKRATGSTYGGCAIALSWHILDGNAGIGISDRFIIMAGTYSDSEPNRPWRWFMRASTWLEVRARQDFSSELAVTCGIPGHDQPGSEPIADVFRVNDAPLDTALYGRCGFQSQFDYSSQAA